MERRYFLERFFLQIGDMPHLLGSDEVKAFLRLEVQADGMKVTKKHELQDLIDKYQDAFSIEEEAIVREMTRPD